MKKKKLNQINEGNNCSCKVMYTPNCTIFFNRQLGLGLSFQICLYFQDCPGSKLLIDCLVV